jgi:hypothetical protein
LLAQRLPLAQGVSGAGLQVEVEAEALAPAHGVAHLVPATVSVIIAQKRKIHFVSVNTTAMNPELQGKTIGGSAPQLRSSQPQQNQTQPPTKQNQYSMNTTVFGMERTSENTVV